MNAALLSRDGEEAWLRLKTHLEWSNHFALCLIFSAHPPVIEVIRERLTEIFRVRVSRLQSFVWLRPDQLADEFLPHLLHPQNWEQATGAPWWLDLSFQEADEWRAARLGFLARLNEQREPLRRNMNRPLVMILPAREREQVRALVPDLWAIRDFTLDTEDRFLAPSPSAPIESTSTALPRPESFPPTELEQSLIAEWIRVSQAERRDRSVLRAGGRAMGALQRLCRFAEAEEIGKKILLQARAMASEAETPESLRDLSVSLDNVGDIDRQLGRLDEARQSYAESLAICRRLIERIGETPESLRDLSVSLNNVGRIDRQLGRLDEARQSYAESLAIRRRLLERIGETPESLRDVSVSLNNVGGVDEQLGHLDQARQSYAESLAIRRRLLERIGETPESLSDLSASLEKVGQVEETIGDVEPARKAFQEGFDIAHRLAVALPDQADYLDLEKRLQKRLTSVGKSERSASSDNQVSEADHGGDSA